MTVSKRKLLLKIILFIIIFYLLSAVVAFFLRDDADSYARVLMHEFYEQDNIDILYCGASHVSHGITPVIADKVTGKNNFNAGTASQTIEGTYALLRQAVQLYKIEKVFLEMDFAISAKHAKNDRNGFSADYLVSQYIKDPRITFDYLTSISAPKYYLNHFLPIGKDKYMTLNPRTIAKKIGSMISGDFFAYAYKSDDSEYDGKGCVLNLDFIKNGTFSNHRKEGNIHISNISDDYKNTIDKIIFLCKENNIELIFYSMPCSDFYLTEKGNYDDYYYFCRDFVNERGGVYYDFNLAKEKYLHLEDCDFSDDNHLSKQGVYKWTEVFCDYFFTKTIPEDDMFYTSYAEKIIAQEDKIFGLYMITSDDKKTMTIESIANHVEQKRISYDVYAIVAGEEMLIAKDSVHTTVALPQGKSGAIRVISYIDGIKQNDCTENFASF